MCVNCVHYVCVCVIARLCVVSVYVSNIYVYCVCNTQTVCVKCVCVIARVCVVGVYISNTHIY